MTNLEKYNNAFLNALEVSLNDLEELEYGLVKNWESLGHMSLIAEIEETFDIEINPEDITQFTNYKVGKKLLKKYNIYVE